MGLVVFLVFGLLVVGFWGWVDLALAAGVFLVVDLELAGFLAGLISVSLGEDLVLGLLSDFVVDLLEVDLVSGILLLSVS